MVLRRVGEGTSKIKVVFIFSVVNNGWNSEIILFWEKSIGRGMSCVRTGESWYLADYGGGGVERELGLQWLRVCRGVLRPLSSHPVSCWTQAQVGEEEPCPALGSQWACMRGGGNKWMASPTSWSLREMQGSWCLSFLVQKQVFMFSFYQLFFCSRRSQSHLWFGGMIFWVSRTLSVFMIFRVIGYCLCVVFFIPHPQLLISVSSYVGLDSVCLWVLELPMLKLLIQIVYFSLMQVSL